MTNIKQKFTKLIISFYCLLAISSCDSTKSTNIKKTHNIHPIIEIAILVPLSGENEILGKQYASLIKMGLADGAKTKIKVTSYDSSDELKLKDSIKKIIDQKTSIIIGPLYSKDTKIVAHSLKDQDIVALSLSNDPTIADKNIFVFGHAPMKQMEQLTNYFLNNDYKNYITLLPAGRHSQIVSKILQNLIANKEAVLNRIEFYNNTEEDITRAINIVSDSVDNLNEQDENLKKPVIIIGDDSENLRKLYKIAKNFNLDKKSIIAGDNRLDVEQDELADIVFTGAIKINDSKLKHKAASLGIHNFSFMHALAYDAGKMIASNISANYSKETFLSRLKSAKKFAGLSGNIYFIDSIAQREYEVIKKQNGNYSILIDQNTPIDDRAINTEATSKL